MFTNLALWITIQSPWNHRLITWLVVWNMTFIFPYIGNNHPKWLIFFRGVETTNQFISFDYQVFEILLLVGASRNMAGWHDFRPVKKCHHPNWLIFFRGVGQPETSFRFTVHGFGTWKSWMKPQKKQKPGILHLRKRLTGKKGPSRNEFPEQIRKLNFMIYDSQSVFF